jgi:hypothetical protein
MLRFNLCGADAPAPNDTGTLADYLIASLPKISGKSAVFNLKTP